MEDVSYIRLIITIILDEDLIRVRMPTRQLILESNKTLIPSIHAILSRKIKEYNVINNIQYSIYKYINNII